MLLDAKKSGVVLNDDYLNEGILALKQYYAVALLDPSNGHALSDKLDPFWHAHMLFSDNYTNFCVDVVGEYMHHVPLLHDDPKKVAQVEFLYDYTISLMPKLFSSINKIFWPTEVPSAELICMHKGNQTIYSEIQSIRMFEPQARLAV